MHGEPFRVLADVGGGALDPLCEDIANALAVGHQFDGVERCLLVAKGDLEPLGLPREISPRSNTP